MRKRKTKAKAKAKRRVGRPPKEPVERPADPDYLTIEEFCVRFAISRSSWPTHRKYLKVVRFGARTLIARTEVDRYVESLTKPAAKEGTPAGFTPPPGSRPRPALVR